jgi:hypothetical protein
MERGQWTWIQVLPPPPRVWAMDISDGAGSPVFGREVLGLEAGYDAYASWAFAGEWHWDH